MKLIIIKLKKIFFPICISLFTLFLIIFSNDNLQAAKFGLSLWANSVVPSILPFFIATELLTYTNAIYLLGKCLNKIMKPLFNVPGEGAFPFIMGIISGYPVGAKIISEFKKEGVFNQKECERLISFTNNSSPLFIIGTIGIGLFKDTKTGILLFITHILACITVGILFRWWGTKKISENEIIVSNSFKKEKLSNPILSISNLGEIFANSIINSINTVLLIGGFIVLFSVILSILQSSKILFLLSSLMLPILSIFQIPSKYSIGFTSGLLELTNGVYNISMITDKNISTNIILCAFLLGFGGFSIVMQVFSIISKTKISIKPYLIGKILQGIFSAFYTYLILINITILNLNL